MQQQGERRKGLEAAAKFEAAIAKNQQALEAVVRQRQLHGSGTPVQGAVTVEEAVEIRASLVREALDIGLPLGRGPTSALLAVASGA